MSATIGWPGRHRTFTTVVVIILVGSLASWLRMPPLARVTAWAEDSNLFLKDAITGLPLQHLFQGYSGYLQFAPRLIADFATLIGGIAWAGVVVNVLCCIAVGLLAAIVFLCSRDVLPSFGLQLLAASITFLAPLLPMEILANAANIHWFFLWTMLWVFLYEPRSRRAAWLLAGVALVAALSEIQVVFFVPLFALHWRSRLSWLPKAGLLLGVLAQLVTTLLAPRAETAGDILPLFRIVDGYLKQTVLPTYVPNGNILSVLFTTHMVWWSVIAMIPFILAFAVALLRGSRIQRLAIIYLVPGSVVLWSAAVVLNRWQGFPPPPAEFRFLRYGVVPSMFLLAALVVAAQVLWSRQSQKIRAVGAIAAVFTLLIMLIAFVPSDTTRSDGPSWLIGAAHARAQCERIPEPATADIIAAPTDFNQRWSTRIACSQILGR